MVQLPATAAIEYVAAGHFFPGGLLAGGDFCQGVLLSGGAYARSPQVQCVYAPSRLSIQGRRQGASGGRPHNPPTAKLLRE